MFTAGVNISPENSNPFPAQSKTLPQIRKKVKKHFSYFFAENRELFCD